MNEWDDRAVDMALHEVCGSKPPDLTARVMLALEEERPRSLPVLQRPPHRSPGRYVLAAAMLALALLLWAWHAAEPVRPDLAPVARVEVLVHEGAIACVEFEPAAAIAIAAGGRQLFTARAGNRLRSPLAARLSLGRFGAIQTAPQTEMEVRSMEFSLKNGVVAASALTLAVVTGTVTWHALTRGETAVAGEVVRLEAPTEEAKNLAAENQRLHTQVDELQRQLDALRLGRETAPVPEPAAPAPAAAAAEAAPEPATVAFTDPAYDAVLAKVDWKTMGEVSKEMQPLLAELIAKLAETGEVSTELALQLQALNPKLAAVLPALLEAKLPGFGPNGTYTHPLIVANTLASTLAANGLPLDATQRAALQGLVRAFSADCAAVDGQQSDFAVERLLAEIEVKDRFFQEVGTRLTPEQFAAIYPEGTQGYDGANLFATGVLTRPVTEPVPARDAAEFARLASSRLAEDLELDEATTKQVRDIVESVSSRAAELWRDKPDATESKLRMLRSGRMTAALRQQIAVMREIQRKVNLTPAQRKKFAQLRGVLVPLPR